MLRQGDNIKIFIRKKIETFFNTLCKQPYDKCPTLKKIVAKKEIFCVDFFFYGNQIICSKLFVGVTSV